MGLRIAQQPKLLPYWDSKDKNIAEFRRRREKRERCQDLEERTEWKKVRIKTGEEWVQIQRERGEQRKKFFLRVFGIMRCCCKFFE